MGTAIFLVDALKYKFKAVNKCVYYVLIHLLRQVRKHTSVKMNNAPSPQPLLKVAHVLLPPILYCLGLLTTLSVLAKMDVLLLYA